MAATPKGKTKKPAPPARVGKQQASMNAMAKMMNSKVTASGSKGK